MKLGEILLKRKLISTNQLEQALNLQCICALKLGELLINKGWLKSSELQLALREQYWREHGFWIID
ncbi:MAG: hypothetical protein AAFO04_22910 [Cyanobacteria bacterium J06592_8]